MIKQARYREDAAPARSRLRLPDLPFAARAPTCGTSSSPASRQRRTLLTVHNLTVDP